MTAHLGRPPRSLLTLAVGAVFKAAGAMGVCAVTDAERLRARGYLAALRDVCTARDRYRLYVRARQFALAGGLALCERYPIPQNRELSGPQLDLFADRLEPTRLGRWLIAIEAAYYKRILLPDLLIVLLVDPEVAVRRKTDEPADYVRQRGELVWSVDWSAAGARVVDAGQPTQRPAPAAAAPVAPYPARRARRGPRVRAELGVRIRPRRPRQRPHGALVAAPGCRVGSAARPRGAARRPRPDSDATAARP